MNCATDMPHQLWEASEGMIHLLTELAQLTEDADEELSQRRTELSGLLPMLAQAYACSQYRHHHLLKQRACERLPELSKAMGKELVPHLPELLKTTATCAGQAAHGALKEEAKQVLQCWKDMYPEDFETACGTAKIDPKVLKIK